MQGTVSVKESNATDRKSEAASLSQDCDDAQQEVRRTERLHNQESPANLKLLVKEKEGLRGGPHRPHPTNTGQISGLTIKFMG